MSSEPITKELIRSWSVEKMKQEMKNPERLSEIESFLRGPEAVEVITELSEVVPEIVSNPVIEELSQQEQEAQQAAVLAAQVEANRQAAEAIEAAEAAHRATAESVKPNKIVVEYQVKDEATGQPIGRPTHLEVSTVGKTIEQAWQEMSLKQQEAHTQATRAFHRLKNQKTTFRKPEPPTPVYQIPLLTDEDRIQAALDLNSQDEEVVVKADRKLRADQILRDQQKDLATKEESRQKKVSQEFLESHENDFNPCQANAALIARYIKDNDLAWTVDNLELAFAATEPQLVPKEAPAVEEQASEAVNPPTTHIETAVPASQVAAIQPAPAEVVAVPAAPAPAANPQAPVARPGVNTGIVPGQMSASRPVTKPVGLTKKEIRDWTPEQMRKEMKNPARLAEINRVLAQR